MTVPIGTRPVTLSLSPAALDLVPDSGLRVVVCRVFVLTPGQLGKPSRLDWETGHRLLEMGNGKWEMDIRSAARHTFQIIARADPALRVSGFRVFFLCLFRAGRGHLLSLETTTQINRS